MLYRDFGKTGEKISVLGFGCMHLPEMEVDGKWQIDYDKATPMLLKAFEAGVNYYDTAPYYCRHNSELGLAELLKLVPREKVMVSTKCPCGDCKEGDDYFRMLERSLKKLGTDYIDFYHFWGIGKGPWEHEVVARGLLESARKAKEQGLIKHISFSFHDKPENIRYIIDDSVARGVPVESMLVQYNLLDRANEEMLAYAHAQGLGTVAMGPVAGGRLVAPTAFSKEIGGNLAPYELALKFVLANQNVSCALSGMANMDAVEKNLRIGELGDELNETEWAQIIESAERLKKFSDLYCTGCGYCQPCAAGINIPHIFNAFTHHNVYGISGHAKNMFNHYVEKEKGKTFADCIGCGQCEEACPQHLEIRAELERVEAVLKGL